MEYHMIMKLLKFNVINQINTNLLYLLYNGLASKYYKQAQA